MNNGNNNGSGAVHDKLDSIKDKAKGLVDQGQEKASEIKAKVIDLVDQGQEKASEIKSKVIDVKDQAVTRGSALLDRATDFIKANPLKAVGIAFGVGYVGMRLIRR